jgi:hypothetical protein
MASYLTGSFLDELFKLCFVKKSFLEVVNEHLKFQYIPKELPEYKFILQSISAQYSVSQKLPSYGIISQQHQANSGVQRALQKIKEADIIDTELAMKQLSEYLKDMKYQLIFDSSVEKYNEGKKEEALKIFMDGAEELSNFTLKVSQGQFLKVFKDFKQQLKDRQLAQENGESSREKIPFGIDILDKLTDGGMSRKDTALWIMQSGKGKSTAVKWTGMYDCRLGYKILHIQLEGSKDEAYDKYAQIFTGSSYNEVKWGNISKDKMMKIEKVIEDMGNKERDISIFSFEKFGAASMHQIRELVIEYNKVEGVFPDLLIIDSLDLCLSGDNKKIDFDPTFKKDRLQAVAQRGKDLAVEFDMAVLFTTQTCDIPKEKWNNPDFTIDRGWTEGDRTLVKPFSHVFTFNQTTDEKKKNIGRVHVDKLRNYDVKDETYPIATAYEQGKFYDKNKAIKQFSYLYESK